MAAFLHVLFSCLAPPQCPSFHRCGQQSPPVDPGLWDDPVDLSSGEGCSRLFGHLGFHRSDSSCFQSTEAPQSHVSEHVRRAPQSRTQGTTQGFTSTYYKGTGVMAGLELFPSPKGFRGWFGASVCLFLFSTTEHLPNRFQASNNFIYSCKDNTVVT